MKKSTKVLATAGIGVGVGVATAAFLKTEKGQEVKEAVKEKVSQLVDEFEEFKKENELDDDLEVTQDERGVVLHLTDNVLFESGQATLIPGSSAILDKIYAIINFK